MNEYRWAMNAEADLRVPNFYPDRPRSWKERPIDVRAEAAAQVGPERRGQIVSRRIEEWREHRDDAKTADTEDGRGQLPVPAIRRRRRADPGYPSGMIRYAGAAGKAYARAWERYSWGLGARPKPWHEFRDSESGQESIGAGSGNSISDNTRRRFRFRLPRGGAE